mgnify:CR=1 FL=1
MLYLVFICVKIMIHFLVIALGLFVLKWIIFLTTMLGLKALLEKSELL